MPEHDEWTARERDEAYSASEKPGDYGCCWKKCKVNGLPYRCTKKPEHRGQCGKARAAEAPKQEVRKMRLDRQVAGLLGKKTSEIAAITAAFVGEIARALAEEGSVRIDCLGTLRVVRRRGKRFTLNGKTWRGKPSIVEVRAKYYVVFRKSAQLREAIRARYGSQGRVVTK